MAFLQVLFTFICLIGYWIYSTSLMMQCCCQRIQPISSHFGNYSFVGDSIVTITCRSLLGLFRHFLLLFSNDSDIVRNAIVSNCKHVYKNRIRGKTKCNPFYYYACKWRFLFFHIPPIRHTLILDLDETLVYSCRFSDLSTMKPSLESIGVTIVFCYSF